MARNAQATSRRIVDAAYGLFYREGFAHVGVDAIAKAAGITKRTLYYHFPSKDDLVAAVLDAQHELALKRVDHWIGRTDDDPAAMVAAVFAEFAKWSSQAGWRGSGFTRAAMEFARSPGHPARKAARRHKATVETLLAEQLDKRGIVPAWKLARQVVLLIEGCHALTLIHGEPGYAHAACEAAQILVAQSAPRQAKEGRIAAGR
jgi:AcrR family transcriptional regulator